MIRLLNNMIYVFERWLDMIWNIDKWEVIEIELWIYLDRRYRWKEKDSRLEFWVILMFMYKGRSEDKVDWEIIVKTYKENWSKFFSWFRLVSIWISIEENWMFIRLNNFWMYLW